MHLLLAVGQSLILILSSRVIGRFFLRKRISLDSRTLHFALDTAAGLAAVSFTVFILTSVRSVTLMSMHSLLVVLTLLAISELVSWRKIAKMPPFDLSALLLLVLLMSAAVFLAALPPMSRDELIYHLEIPKRILNKGGWPLFQDNIYGYFPHFTEMIYVFNLGTAGETGAHLTHVIFGFLLAASLYGFSRGYLSAHQSLLAVCIFFTVPTVLEILPTAYADLPFTLYSFLSLVCLMHFIKKNRRWFLVVSAAFAGLAASVKYTGIQLTMISAVVLWSSAFKPFAPEGMTRPYRQLFYDTCLFLTVAALPILPYLVRNYCATGWPLYPFSILGLPLKEGFNWDAARSDMYLYWLAQFGTPLGQENVLHTLFAPVLVFIYGKFNSPQFYEGVLGPIFLLAPGAVFFRGKDFKIRLAALFCGLFFYYWALTTKQARFLIPVLPWLSFFVACAAVAVKGPVIKILAAGAMLMNLWIGYHEWALKSPMTFWEGVGTADTYLSKQVPSYSFYRGLHSRLKSGDKVFMLHLKNYGYWMRKPWTSDFIFERLTLDQLMKTSPDDAALHGFFKNRGANHIAVDLGFLTSPQWGMEPSDLNRFLNFLKNHSDVIWERGPYLLVKLK